MNEFQEYQKQGQKELKCDYVLMVYAKDPKSEPGKPPKYMMTREPWPVKLKHQVFMELSFSILKGRLLTSYAELSKERAQLAKFHREARTAAEGDEGGATLALSDAMSQHQADLVSMFQFLTHFANQMQTAADLPLQPRPQLTAKRSQPSRVDELNESTASSQYRPSISSSSKTAGTRGRGSAVSATNGSSRGTGTGSRLMTRWEEDVARSNAQRTKGATAGGGTGTSRTPLRGRGAGTVAPAQPALTLNGKVLQQVRFQLLLEYGQDPLALSKTISHAHVQRHLARTSVLPAEVSEDEFWNQMGKPSGMAQECSLM